MNLQVPENGFLGEQKHQLVKSYAQGQDPSFARSQCSYKPEEKKGT